MTLELFLIVMQTVLLLAQTTTAPTVALHSSFREQLGTATDRRAALHTTLTAAIAQVAMLSAARA